MEKPIFYCDCDGVILNTIEVAFQIIRENEYKINLSNREEVDKYFRTTADWNKIYDRVKIINDADERLRYLKRKKIFEDVMILTKISGGITEEKLKLDLFNKLLPTMKVITLQYGLSKSLAVPSKGNLLVDDEIGNCSEWKNNDGTAILFSPYMRKPEQDIISDLCELTETQGVKKLLKTRNF